MNNALRIRISNQVLRIENSWIYYELSRPTAGLPGRLGFQGDRQPVFEASRPVISVELERRGRVFPVLREFKPEVVQSKDLIRVQFNDIGWQDRRGKDLPGYRLSLAYEFHGDGTVFVTTFFYTETLQPGQLTNLVLEPRFTLAKGQDANWAYWRLPDHLTAKLIQDLSHFERNLTRKDTRQFKGNVLPLVSFDFGAEGQRDHHLEFFVESRNSLTGDHTNTETSIGWKGPKATVQWNFAKAARDITGRTYHWRNIWGWCLRRFPVERRHPPFRIFHYLDNFDHYPTEKVIRQVAEQGANVFILHENWRLDVTNDEVAYDHQRLKRMIAACHRHGLRVGLYTRGNEDGIRKSYAEYLRPYLRRNWDGIYMDYGSPAGYLGLEENAPGGRIGFREYHTMTRKIREFVGPDGFHISHSGSFFSAIGHTYVDAYLGGEQEKGALLKNPTLHAYFSGLSIAPSTLWTAAFPTYRTPKAVPFLASTLQAPFLHLGTQVPYSSLSHPQVPSLVTFARPLWRLWELFDGLKDIRGYCTQSTQGLFTPDSAATGVSMMVTRQGEILLIAANFADTAREINVRVNWRQIGLSPGRAWFALNSNGKSNQYRPLAPSARLRTRLEGCGVGGWLIVKNRAAWTRKLARFARPYVSAPEEAAYRQHLAEIQAKRFGPPGWNRCYLRVSIPNWPNNYEDSIWFDLFENTIELQDLSHPDRPKRIAYISRRGLAAVPPQKKDYIWPGVATPWIALHAALRNRGTIRPVQLGLATRRGKFEFYSFVKAEVSPQPSVCPQTRELVYNNDIDLDWSLLTFRV